METAPIALTMGEPAGIGGELTLAAWARRRPGDPVWFAIDDPDRLGRLARALCVAVPVAAIDGPEDAAGVGARALPVLPLAQAVRGVAGRCDLALAPAVVESIDRAVGLVQEGRASALVTNPIAKASLYAAGFQHPGHTEYLAALAGGGRALMMLAVGRLRVVPLTVHVPLRRVPDLVTFEAVVGAATALIEALRRDFGVRRPRLVVAGLNPHAGEGGAMGGEAEDVIAPAVGALRAAGHDVRGPLAADTLFHARARATYDAALCMYHDQALIPVKTLGFDRAVNITLGLPFVRTSPDHGTALDIAGRGIARPDSLIAAIATAARLAARRRRQEGERA